AGGGGTEVRGPCRVLLGWVCVGCSMGEEPALPFPTAGPRGSGSVSRVTVTPWGLVCVGNVSVSCEAESAHPELTLLYWLGNGSFVEHRLSRREETRGSLLTLRRDLSFTSFSFQDLNTNFTCVLLSPDGFDIEELKWAPSDPPTPPLPTSPRPRPAHPPHAPQHPRSTRAARGGALQPLPFTNSQL
uniref:Ig-like domain-containing protein n=1 Tax=Coturnix japonica TaxID=93934 RepID=A0A8C2SZB0_COTJA